MNAMIAWWRSLRDEPEPLTTNQRRLALLVAAIGALSRLAAVAAGPWDWDEMLFALGVRAYDVASHHPHPPGFPVFIGAAKLLHALGASEFHSMQIIVVVAAMIAAPAMFVLCRELRVSVQSSATAALVLVFFPNVWFFGGTAFSDLPSLVLILAALAMWLRGARSVRVLLIAALLTGLAAGIRPQNLLIAFIPAVIGASHQLQRKRVAPVVGAVLIVGCVVGISYGSAAQITGWQRYRTAVKEHREYITATDSFLSPTRPSPVRLLDDFFVWPYRALVVNVIVTLLAAASLFRLRPPLVIMLLAFAPFAIAAWLLLDHFSASRFSIGYAPLLALAVAEGIALLSERSRFAYGALVLVTLGSMAVWVWPSLRQVRVLTSPPLAATTWIAGHVDPRHAVIDVQRAMKPFAYYALPQYRLHILEEDEPDVQAPERYLLQEGLSAAPGARNFTWPRGRLYFLTRQRYFEVSVVPVTTETQR